MSASTLFRLPTDPTEMVSWSSDWEGITRAALPGGGEILYVRVVAGAYEEEFRMTRFGASLVEGGTLIGVAYGYVFRVRQRFDPPNAEIFYDWCDSANGEVAAVARWILDSGDFDRLFHTGDVLVIDAYEFLRDVPTEEQRAALRVVATELKRRFRRLGQSVIAVHPHRLGPAPKAKADARRVTAYRRALQRLLAVIGDVRLGAVLKDGSRFFASGAMSPLWGPGRRLRGFTKICRDATDKKLHEEELRRIAEEARIAREAAEDADRLKDEFLAGVSHELRTPLNAIIGWITLLKSERDDPEALAEGIDSIERNAHAQARLIEDILDISRITAGKLRINPTRVHLVEALEAAEAAIGPAAISKGVQVEHHHEPVPELVADSERLQQILCNLLHNAVKFTPAGGRATTTIQNGRTLAVITVKDTGEGIDGTLLPHVFEPFRQGDGGSTRRAAGVGLGLAITRHLVEAHGGVITASSAGLGKGSSFTVELPLPVSLPKGDIAPVLTVEARTASTSRRARSKGRAYWFWTMTLTRGG